MGRRSYLIFSHPYMDHTRTDFLAVVANQWQGTKCSKAEVAKKNSLHDVETLQMNPLQTKIK